MTQEEKQHLLKIDVCGRLPYGLYFVDQVYKKTFTLLSINKSGYEMELFLHEDHNVLISQGNSLYEDAYTPILRPIEDLCREITHAGYNDGKPFVPIVEFIKLVSKYFKWDNGRHKIKIDDSHIHVRVYSKVLNAWGTEMSLHLNPKRIDKLNEWMIDYRGLIPAGIATSVHDLDKNPYE